MPPASPSPSVGADAGSLPRTATPAGPDSPGTSPPPVLVAAAAAAMVVAVWASFLYAPSERVQGDVQRLMYMHVPAALTMYVAVTLVFLASLMYLQSRNARWDEVGAAAAEVGTLFGTIVLVTGPLWARPIWGAWWTWDARLTSFFVLWLIFVAYVMLRAWGGPPEQVARYCAVLGIIGFIDVPITHYSVKWWRGMHPEPMIMSENGFGSGMPSSMLGTFGIAMGAFVLLFAALFALRLRIERQERRVLAMRRRLDDLQGEVTP